MVLLCLRAFGNFKPGDEVEVPDGAVFDAAYFELLCEPVQPAEPEDSAPVESE